LRWYSLLSLMEFGSRKKALLRPGNISGTRTTCP
jgi:hypothetical protein